MFHTNIINIYGEKGKAWLDGLPQRVACVASRMYLRDLLPVPDLSYNYVLSGFQRENPIILKLGYDHNAMKRENYVLQCFKGHGAIKVLDREDGVLLLERAIPGTSLKSYFPNKEEKSIKIACDLIKKLHCAPIPKSHGLYHIRDELSILDKNWDIPSVYLKKGRMLREQLLKSSGPDVLLHGDLHHANILKNDHEWIAIDPKGVIGEQVYELAAFIRNPIPELLNHTDAPNIIQNRIEMFSETLNMSKAKILDWCFVQTILAWIWAVEESCDTTHFEQLTKIFDTLNMN